MRVSVGGMEVCDMSESEHAAPGASQAGPFWWCLTHGRVEPNEGCANTVRLGPYPTFDDASKAIERAHERSRAWDEDGTWGG